GLVRVAVAVHAAGEGRGLRVAYVHDVEAAADELAGAVRHGVAASVHAGRATGGGAAPGEIGVAGLLVDGEGVRAADVVVVRGLGEGLRRKGDVAELGQVEDLRTVVGYLADNVEVVTVDLDAAPEAEVRVVGVRGEV